MAPDRSGETTWRLEATWGYDESGFIGYPTSVVGKDIKPDLPETLGVPFVTTDQYRRELHYDALRRQDRVTTLTDPLISGGSREATGFLGHNGFEFKNLHAVRNEATVINGHGVTRHALRERESSGEPLEGFTRRRGWTAQRLRSWQKRLGEWKEGGLGGAMLAPVVTITGVHDGRR